MVLSEGYIFSNTSSIIDDSILLKKIRYLKGLNAACDLIFFYYSNKPFFVLRTTLSSSLIL